MPTRDSARRMYRLTVYRNGIGWVLTTSVRRAAQLRRGLSGFGSTRMGMEPAHLNAYFMHLRQHRASMGLQP